MRMYIITIIITQISNNRTVSLLVILDGSVAMAHQHVAQPEQQQPLTLQEGFIQSCQGYLERKSKYLKRWKRRWFAVEPAGM